MAFRWVLVITLLLGGVLSAIIPPGKSPDEADHMVRAYLLSRGHVFLKTEPCQGENALCHNGSTMSGGLVDRGLLEYFWLHDPNQRYKESMLDLQAGRAIPWRGEEVFFHAPGTGYYFPLVYLPQATALALGKTLGLTVQNSYYLARVFAMTSGGLVLTLAFYIFWPQPAVLALLLVPMSLFQTASASIDFLCNALAVLVIACFLRVATLRKEAPNSLFWMMALAVFLLGTARAHLASMVLLMAAAARPTRRIQPWAAAATATVAILAWMALAIPATIDFRVPRGVSIGQVAAYYLEAPLQLVRVLAHTVTDGNMLNSYVISFLGVFFDQPLTQRTYAWLTGLVTLVILSCLASPRHMLQAALARSALVLTGVAGTLLALLAMLFTWSPHPATLVQGVQGRYLLVPAMLLLLALCSWEPAVQPWRQRLRWALLFVLGGVSLLVSVHRLLYAYYVQPVVALPNAVRAEPGVLEPSPPLGPGSTIMLQLPPAASEPTAHAIHGIGFLVGTYGRTLQGTALLTLTDRAGRLHRVKIGLDDVIDNTYVFARVPPAHYRQAELRVIQGQGAFSVWTVRPVAGNTARPEQAPLSKTCTVTIHEDSSMQLMSRCPTPK
ncbi:MAG: DUF2142 domain-containing protein [Lautropia mirabilis]